MSTTWKQPLSRGKFLNNSGQHGPIQQKKGNSVMVELSDIGITNGPSDVTLLHDITMQLPDSPRDGRVTSGSCFMMWLPPLQMGISTGEGTVVSYMAKQLSPVMEGEALMEKINCAPLAIAPGKGTPVMSLFSKSPQ